MYNPAPTVRIWVLVILQLCVVLTNARFLKTTSQTLFLSSLSNRNKKGSQKVPTRILNLVPASIPVVDVGVSLFATGASIAWLQIWIFLAKQGTVSPVLSRKVIHSGSAPLFMALWTLYSHDSNARYVAAVVPALQAVRLAAAGLRKRSHSSTQPVQQATASNAEGKINTAVSSGDLVNAISRSGDQKEALQGPLIYTLVLLTATAFFFRESSVGMIAVSQMAVGDGLADIIGRRWGKQKWPFAQNKSYIGSLAFVVGAFLASYAMLAYFSYTGYLGLNVFDAKVVFIVLAISVICAAVELVPIGDDNVTVPLVGALAAWFLIEPLLLK